MDVFFCILGPPYCGIGATIRIGREMLCLPYAGFLIRRLGEVEVFSSVFSELVLMIFFICWDIKVKRVFILVTARKLGEKKRKARSCKVCA